MGRWESRKGKGSKSWLGNRKNEANDEGYEQSHVKLPNSSSKGRGHHEIQVENWDIHYLLRPRHE